MIFARNALHDIICNSLQWSGFFTRDLVRVWKLKTFSFLYIQLETCTLLICWKFYFWSFWSHQQIAIIPGLRFSDFTLTLLDHKHWSQKGQWSIFCYQISWIEFHVIVCFCTFNYDTDSCVNRNCFFGLFLSLH